LGFGTKENFSLVNRFDGEKEIHQEGRRPIIQSCSSIPKRRSVCWGDCPFRFCSCSRSGGNGKYYGKKIELIGAPQSGNSKASKQKKGVKFELPKESVQLKRDHVTSLGFKNDGYDYNQHLKVMGMMRCFWSLSYTIYN
jgi:hypothetical protein